MAPAEEKKTEETSPETPDAQKKAAAPKVSLNEARKVTKEVSDAIDDSFDYHPWDEKQKEAGAKIRAALGECVKVIIENAPPCPDRSVAIRKIREARMDANSAITHRGKY